MLLITSIAPLFNKAVFDNDCNTASWLLYHAMVLNTINHLALYICIAMQHNAGADLGLYRSSISQIQLLYNYDYVCNTANHAYTYIGIPCLKTM